MGISAAGLTGQLLIGLINGAALAMLSLGLAIIFGLLNIINFTHGAQYMMGAFFAWLLLNTPGHRLLAGAGHRAGDRRAHGASCSNSCSCAASTSSTTSTAFSSPSGCRCIIEGALPAALRRFRPSLRHSRPLRRRLRSRLPLPAGLPRLDHRLLDHRLLRHVVPDRADAARRHCARRRRIPR